MKHEYFEHGDGKYANLYVGYSVCLFYEFLSKIGTEMQVNVLFIHIRVFEKKHLVTFTLIIRRERMR
jgi:hypothetical protein